MDGTHVRTGADVRLINNINAVYMIGREKAGSCSRLLSSASSKICEQKNEKRNIKYADNCLKRVDNNMMTNVY